MKYMKFMPGNPIIYSSRNIHEVLAAQELGYEVTVISSDGDQYANADQNPWGCICIFDGLPKLTFQIPRVKRAWMIVLGRARLVRMLRNQSKDIISCHDITALALGYLSTLFVPRGQKPKLIYDSHEFELGRTAGRNRCTLWFIAHLERFLMKRCAFSIMVNDSIADEVRRIHNLKDRPIVVRSTPPNWRLDTAKIAGMRAIYCAELKVPSDTFLMMYHGAIFRNRGIENLLHALAGTQGTAAVILGNGAEGYLNQLRTLATQLGVGERALFLPAAPLEELYQYVGAADVGMITIQAVNRNHYYSLPNKLFENIQSLTPVICSDFQEMGGLVRRYDIGLPVDTTDIRNIVAAVERLRTDKELYARLKQNLLRAKEELCWENEKRVLQAAVQKIGDPGRLSSTEA